MTILWDKYFYKLVGDQGSADQFAAALDQAMPDAIRTDLQAELRTSLVLVKPQDAMIAGWAGLADGDPADRRARARQHELEAGQTMTEGLVLQMRRTLDLTAGNAGR